MCKIQFQDNDSESEEEFADFNVQETCSRMIPVSSSSKSVKIRFQYPDSNTSGDDESIQNEDEIDKQLTEIFGDLSEETSQPCSETSSEYTNNCSIGTITTVLEAKGVLLKFPCWQKCERTDFNIINSNLPPFFDFFSFKKSIYVYLSSNTEPLKILL